MGSRLTLCCFIFTPQAIAPGLWLCSRLCLMWNCLRLVCPWSWLCTTQPDLFLYQFHLLSIESSTSSNVCKLTTCCRIQIPDFYFLNKGALIIGIADKRPLIQRVMFWPYLLSRERCSAVTLYAIPTIKVPLFRKYKSIEFHFIFRKS